ncbi:hypothetical protein BH09BAC5_BH09BAC5_11540 [soil metagenome]
MPDGTRSHAWVNSEGHNHLGLRADTLKDSISAGCWINLKASLFVQKLYSVNVMQITIKRNGQELLNRMLPVNPWPAEIWRWTNVEHWGDCPIDLLPGDIVYSFVYVNDGSKIFLNDYSVKLVDRKICGDKK